MDFAIIQKDTPFFVKIRMYTKAKTRKPGSTFPILKMMLMMSVTDRHHQTDRQTNIIDFGGLLRKERPFGQKSYNLEKYFSCNYLRHPPIKRSTILSISLFP